MERITAKTILSSVSYGNQWFGIDYNMNLYRGCSHGCIYCDSRSSCYQVDHFDTVRVKGNALVLLRQELSRKRKKGVIGIGAMSDTYNPHEKRLCMTRQALEIISEFGFGVSIDTKSDLIIRDIDLLKKIAKRQPVIIKITITAADDTLSRQIEPRVCPSSKRFAVIKKLSEAGLFVGILMNPILPWITDSEDNIRRLVLMAHQSGAKFIHTYFNVTLRENQRTYYYEQLDQRFPGLKEKYQRHYKGSYFCPIPEKQKMERLFKRECERYGILYRMDDIIHAYRPAKNMQKQLKLFD